MNTTINISLPKTMYEDTKKMLGKRGYASISEFIREALRTSLYPRLTENGFTPEFEEEILEAAKEPISKSMVWLSEADINRYFDKLKTRIVENDQNKKSRKVRQNALRGS